jgi:hypothetical protein
MLLLIESPISYSTLVLFPRFYARKEKFLYSNNGSQSPAKKIKTKGKPLNNSKVREQDIQELRNRISLNITLSNAFNGRLTRG